MVWSNEKTTENGRGYIYDLKCVKSSQLQHRPQLESFKKAHHSHNDLILSLHLYWRKNFEEFYLMQICSINVTEVTTAYLVDLGKIL